MDDDTTQPVVSVKGSTTGAFLNQFFPYTMEWLAENAPASCLGYPGGDVFGLSPIPIPICIFLPNIISVSLSLGNMSQARYPNRWVNDSMNYTIEECIHFLDLMEESLPIGPEEWEKLVSDRSSVYAGRTVNSLRRKYKILHRKPIPTGDPTIPSEVKQAKRVKFMIGQRVNIGGGEEEYNMENLSFEVDIPKNLGIDTAQMEEVCNNFTMVARRYPSAAFPSILSQPLQLSQSQQPKPAQPNNTQVCGTQNLAPGTQTTTQATTTQPSQATCTPGSQSTSANNVSSTSTSTSPQCRKPSPQDTFIELMKLQMIKEAKSCEADRIACPKERETFCKTVSLVVTGIAEVFGIGHNKKKRK